MYGSVQYIHTTYVLCTDQCSTYSTVRTYVHTDTYLKFICREGHLGHNGYGDVLVAYLREELHHHVWELIQGLYNAPAPRMTRHACIHRTGRETATLPKHSYTHSTYIHTNVQSLWPVHTALSSESQCTLTFPEHSQSHHVGGVVLGVVLQEFLAHILPSRGGKTHQCLFVTFSKHIIGDTYIQYIH